MKPVDVHKWPRETTAKAGGHTGHYNHPSLWSAMEDCGVRIRVGALGSIRGYQNFLFHNQLQALLTDETY